MLGSVSLIGMPGSGKTTIGRALANLSLLPHIDTDDLIVKQYETSTQDLLDNLGARELSSIEENVVCNLSFDRKCIVSTGGSVIYSRKAMEYLKKSTTIVFLSISYQKLCDRGINFSNRGLINFGKVAIASLFEERSHLYMNDADVVIDCNNISKQEIVQSIIESCRP